MTTPTLMRTASGPAQPYLPRGSGTAGSPFGRSRRGGFLPSLRSLRLFGRRGAGSLRRTQSEAKMAVEEQDQELAILGRKGLSPGVRSGVGVAVPEEVEFAGGDGAGGGSGGGGKNGGGGGGGGRDRRERTGCGGQSEMGAYYQEMLEADPGNPLLLRNYGQFLHEVEGDVERAEDCYGRAILASPGDGEVLSLYGKLIWDAHRDEDRAEAYFERAVEASPDDCYVLGSYAHFLWDAEEEEDGTSSSATPPSSQQHVLEAYRGHTL